MKNYADEPALAMRFIAALAVILMLSTAALPAARSAAADAAADTQTERGPTDPKVLLKQASMYLHGHGVAADPERALALYHEAAEQDIAFAQFRLARLLLDGDREVRDLERGMAWLRRAAGLGFVDAQLELSRLYQSGGPVDADLVKAYKWLHIADSLTAIDLDDRRAELEAAMSFVELTRARFLARRCIYRGYRDC